MKQDKVYVITDVDPVDFTYDELKDLVFDYRYPIKSVYCYSEEVTEDVIATKLGGGTWRRLPISSLPMFGPLEMAMFERIA